MSPLRVGMLAPITHRLPPDGYGPWEQVVSALVEGLVGRGVEVTLFAAAGTATSARLVETVPAPLSQMAREHPGESLVDEGGWLDPGPDPRVWEELHIATAMELARDGAFDVVHSHLHVHALVFSRMIPSPLLSTLHGSAWNRAHHPVLAAYTDQAFVSISDAERAFFPGLRYVATVHNGIQTDRFTLGDGEGGFLLFAGRMAPEKAPHLAAQVAREAGRRLVMAGPVEDRYQAYFADRVQPLLGVDVEYVGALDQADLASLYREAAATLMPLMWDEPFGLVVAESLASGTPVIAWRRGAMPELIRDGVTGFLVESVEQAVEAVGRVAGIDRGACRADAEQRLGVDAMAEGYLRVYETLASVERI